MIEPARMDQALRTRVEMELQPGERIVWMDQPIPGRMARGSWALVVFGIPWTAFAVFWTAMAAKGVSSEKGAGPFILFPLFGVPFILIGLGMLTSPYWARRRATRVAYVVTDRRAIILQGGWRGSMSIRSFEPAALTDLNRTQHADGSGDLVFTHDFRRGSKGRTYTTDVGFIGVRDVRSVEEHVRALAAKASAPR
jgi:hypothetical protein